MVTCHAVRRLGRAALRAGVVVALACGAFAVRPQAARAAPQESPAWSSAARPAVTQANRLIMEAGTLIAGDQAVEAEQRLRAAFTLRPDDAELAAMLVDLQMALGHDAGAVATLERSMARRRAGLDTALWSRLGALRAKLGRYGEAATAYGEAAAAGTARAETYANLAEVLMADGRLGEAAARYRDAVSVATSEATGERRSRSQDLALAYYGLAVALDRDDQRVAAREMIARALVQDPGGALLKVALIPGGDLFFVPDGEVYYYLGLAAEAEGRTTDAEASFREFLAHRPQSRWAAAAQFHLRPAGAGQRDRAARVGRAPASGRVVAIGTVQASGGIGAPLMDAAWRERGSLIDGCLEGVVGQGTVRFALEMQLDGHGTVTRATVKAPPSLDGGFARCVESAVKRELKVSVPPRAKPTTARTEVIVAFP
jgi:tetratricopeptide (TPR) repeat protein